MGFQMMLLFKAGTAGTAATGSWSLVRGCSSQKRRFGRFRKPRLGRTIPETGLFEKRGSLQRTKLFKECPTASSSRPNLLLRSRLYRSLRLPFDNVSLRDGLPWRLHGLRGDAFLLRPALGRLPRTSLANAVGNKNFFCGITGRLGRANSSREIDAENRGQVGIFNDPRTFLRGLLSRLSALLNTVRLISSPVSTPRSVKKSDGSSSRRAPMP